MSILCTHLLHFSANLLKYFFYFHSPCSASSMGFFSPKSDVNAGLRPILPHAPSFFPLPDFCCLAFAT